MARSDEAEWWFNAVYSAVQEVPHGHVTSYAHIARLLGQPQRPRQVGVCLKHLPSYSPTGNHLFHNQNVPWQRIVNSKGIISPRGRGAAANQGAELMKEGVAVVSGNMGELSVDFRTNGWFPDILPSEEAESSESESV